MMQTLEKEQRRLRRLLLFWTGFIGFGAVVGTMMFLLDPQSGFIMGNLLEPMRTRLPFGELLFRNLIFSGIALLTVNGLTNLTAFVLLLRRRSVGIRLGMLFGLTLMAWIGIQFYTFAPTLYLIDVAFFAFGLAQFLCGYRAWVVDRQQRFLQDNPPSDDRLAGNREAVLYFSRLGYVRRHAAQLAQGRDLLALRTLEPTAGLTGFWWCGRFAMHRWGMKLAPLPVEPAQYERLILVSPVWVFRLCAPMRRFLTDYGASLSHVELTLVHHMRAVSPAAFREAEKLLGKPLEAKHSVCCRLGRER